MSVGDLVSVPAWSHLQARGLAIVVDVDGDRVRLLSGQTLRARSVVPVPSEFWGDRLLREMREARAVRKGGVFGWCEQCHVVHERLGPGVERVVQ